MKQIPGREWGKNKKYIILWKPREVNLLGELPMTLVSLLVSPALCTVGSEELHVFFFFSDGSDIFRNLASKVEWRTDKMICVASC